ncbi:MAG: Gfo/Idh/MocA family oxidoreductase [Clostridia bacterium]|nr:Gfo/Idh/MocA family oxidoreductase [Clostridia bacterium]
MKKLNIAIIGQGRSGRDIHGKFFRSESNTKYNVIAVVDAIEERRIRAKEEWKCDVYADYRELFGRTDIDLVVNSSFSHMHADITIDLLKHGFNVVCEKPFAKNYEECARIVDAAEKSGKMLNVFQQSRFAPYYTKLLEIIDSGVLGRPIQYSISFSGFGRRWDWQTYQGYNGGEVRNTGPHPLDQAINILGFDSDISVFSKLDMVNTFGDAEDYAKIILTAPGKPLVDVELSKCNAYNSYIYLVHCQYGTLKAGMNAIDYKYYNPKTAPEQKLILEPLFTEERTPAYCSEQLEWTEEHIDLAGTSFDTAVEKYYDMIYDNLVNGKEMEVTPYQVLKQFKVIDLIRSQNPLEVKVAE